MNTDNKVISLRQFFIENTLANFNNYHNYLEEHSKRTLKDFENKIEIEKSKFKTEEEKEEFEEYCADEYQRLRDELPQILRRSIFFSIYSFCKNESHKQIPRNFEEIDIFRRIRNCIAHSDSMLDYKDSRNKGDAKIIKEYAINKPGISINDRNEIIMEPAYIKHVTNVFKGYFINYFQNQKKR